MSLWLKWTSSNIDQTASAIQHRATICLWYHCSGGEYQSRAGSFLCTGPCQNWKDLLMDSTVSSISFTGQSGPVHCFIWHCILTSAWRFNCSLSIQHSIKLYIYNYMPNIHPVFTCSLASYCISDHLKWNADAAQIQLDSSQHNSLWHSAEWKPVWWHSSGVQWWFHSNITCDQPWCISWSGCGMYAINLMVAEFNHFNLYRKHVTLYWYWQYHIELMNCKDVIWFFTLWADHTVINAELMIYCLFSLSTACLLFKESAISIRKLWIFQKLNNSLCT